MHVDLSRGAGGERAADRWLRTELRLRMLANFASLVRTGIRSGYRGTFVRRVERELGRVVGRTCLTTSSGTAALELALTVCGVAPGDEVVVPALGALATFQAVLRVGAVPVCAPVDRERLTLDPERFETCLSPRSRAVVFIHLFGNPSGVLEIAERCTRHGLVLIEDAAAALGGYVGERPAGAIGAAAAFSFASNKSVSAGEGGAMACADPNRVERARALRHAGLVPGADGHEARFVAGKCLLSEPQAAAIDAQLQLRLRLERRRAELAASRCSALERELGLRPVLVDHGHRHAWQTVAVQAESRVRADRLLGCAGLRRYGRRPVIDEPIIADAARCGSALRDEIRELWARCLLAPLPTVFE